MRVVLRAALLASAVSVMSGAAMAGGEPSFKPAPEHRSKIDLTPEYRKGSGYNYGEPPAALNQRIEPVANRPGEPWLERMMTATRPYLDYMSAAVAVATALGGILMYLALKLRAVLHRRKWARMRTPAEG